ncbi:hypothetical protein Pst134EB_006010 [Puccinia striiformis f. sp. tritici]|nr:hypothetical protein Pst134EB_006010 [Puccinia striiformis f. sp. tritici]
MTANIIVTANLLGLYTRLHSDLSPAKGSRINGPEAKTVLRVVRRTILRQRIQNVILIAPKTSQSKVDKPTEESDGSEEGRLKVNERDSK